MIRAASQAGHNVRGHSRVEPRPSVRMYWASPVAGSVDQRQPNERLKQTPHVGVLDLSPVRRCLAADR